ncbi:GAF and ANTAR domain-containing protein [Clavibacter tessellarius]|uniref:Transcriptional regulator n=1 Tax=Clavibacter tessellarius TaxID=31965 RepID=A0A225CLU7_9MICO|nr:GAF and ANTAR domain-containing protein [Clavibacter michiganensis]OQJ62712.1 transcriptional regulator [Clavibacter michiganensis subsp. tessellarius]UKF34301.1 GAF and ANTAR domain-containing protein [Clavibacter michiganensis subsp. tessellarius]
MPDTREAQLVHTFVSLADSLVGDFDVLDLLQTLVDQVTLLFDAGAAGIIIGPDAEHLEVVASTSEKSRLVGLMQLEVGEGPCVEAVSTGRVVSVSDVREIADRWPAFSAQAAGAGYVSVHAIPLRLRGQIIGSLNLFREHEGVLNEADATAAQALADVATISVLQERTIRDSSVVHDQLRHALDSRVLIEQAKGVISHTLGVDMDEAFRLIRNEARSTSTAMPAVAAGIVEGRVTLRASAR